MKSKENFSDIYVGCIAYPFSNEIQDFLEIQQNVIYVQTF